MRKSGSFLAAIAAAALLGAPAASADPVVLFSTLSGDAESPPVTSTGTGTSIITLDDDANTLRIQIAFSDLVGDTVMAHIHCCLVPPAENVSVATELPSFTGFPLGVTFGTYDHTFDTSDGATFNPGFVSAQGGIEQAEDALFAGLINGRAYLNIHTTFVRSGEIRGFFAVPEPGSLALLGIAGVVVAAMRRRRS